MNQPLKKFRAGQVSCALWENEVTVNREAVGLLKASGSSRPRRNWPVTPTTPPPDRPVPPARLSPTPGSHVHRRLDDRCAASSAHVVQRVDSVAFPGDAPH